MCSNSIFFAKLIKLSTAKFQTINSSKDFNFNSNLIFCKCFPSFKFISIIFLFQQKKKNQDLYTVIISQGYEIFIHSMSDGV